LQNISRDAKDFKSCFVSDPGYLFVKSDLAQAEFRCWAHYSGDQDMIRDIELVDAGLLADIHKQTASEVFNIPVEEVTKDQRTAAKNTVFGLLYGRGSSAISAQYGITVEQAECVKERFFSRYPVAAQWLRDIVNEAREKGAVKTWFGRIRRIPKIHSDNMGDRAEAERQAKNSPIQGQASDMNNAYMMRIWREARKRGIDCYPAATIHDDNTLQVKEGQEDQLVEVMRYVVANSFPDFKCKMKLEFKKGNNLGYMEDVK
jgi:DNA polymerase-1